MSDGISAYKMPLRTIRSPRRRGGGRKNRPRRYRRSGNFSANKKPTHIGWTFLAEKEGFEVASQPLSRCPKPTVELTRGPRKIRGFCGDKPERRSE